MNERIRIVMLKDAVHQAELSRGIVVETLPARGKMRAETRRFFGWKP